MPPPLNHHAFTLTDVNVDILNGASLMVNYLGKTVGDNLDPSLQDNMNDIAVLILENGANVKIKGFEDETSAHAYFGNGFVRLEAGSSLSLEGGAGLHFSAHKEGFFENPYNENGTDKPTQDPHKHASIELNGGKLNLVLDTKSHLYSDHILSFDHKHNLIGATSYTPDGGANAYTGDIAEDITFSLTTEALNRIDTIIRDDVDEAWAEQNHLSFEQIKMLQHIKDSGDYTDLLTAVTATDAPSTLSTLYQKFLDGKGEGDSEANKQQFNDLLNTLVTVGMNNDVHGDFSFQKYGVQFTDKGAYMYVLDTLSVEEFIKKTGINICIKNQVNEVLDDLSSTSAEQAKLLNTGAVTDKNSGAYQLINNALDAVTTYSTSKDVAVAAARLLDSSAQVATVAGAQTLAWDMLQTRGDSLQRHLDSVKDVPPQKLNLWADMLYMNNRSHNMWTDVNGERDVTADLGGFITGADYRFHDKAMAGASFAFMGGNAETHLGNDLGLDINNDIYALSASAYAQYEIQPGLRVRGDVDIQHADNNIEMTTPALFNIQDKITADTNTNAVQVFAAVEKDFSLANDVVLTPYLGAKYTYLRTDGYTSKVGNKDAFKVDAADQHIVSVPVEVKVSKDIVLENGKTVTPRGRICPAQLRGYGSHPQNPGRGPAKLRHHKPRRYRQIQLRRQRGRGTGTQRTHQPCP